jgi:serine/threonine protein kinase
VVRSAQTLRPPRTRGRGPEQLLQDALTSGARIGSYEVIDRLGAGGMGEVYRARDTRLDRTVAIKIVPQHLSSSAGRRRAT